MLITQGFIARSPNGDTVLLGRGGSDTSAAVLGAALEADEIEIWTDVDGVYSADPRVVDAATLVPGDIVLLTPGAAVPADMRLLEAEELAADESALTGESLAVAKMTDALGERDLPLGDRHSMAYSGSVITRGRGAGVRGGGPGGSRARAG